MTMISQYAFFFDASSCSGCKACQMACQDKHDLAPGILWRRVYEVAGGTWEKKDGIWVPNLCVYNVSMACNHCQDPVCATSCPTRAIWKRDDGIVLIDVSRCIGCRYCEWACPYSAIRFDAVSNRVSKCTFCSDLLDAGEPPACVAACPERVLDFGDLDDLKKKHGEVQHVVPLPDPSQTQPALIIKPHRDSISAGKLGAEVQNWEEV